MECEEKLSSILFYFFMWKIFNTSQFSLNPIKNSIHRSKIIPKIKVIDSMWNVDANEIHHTNKEINQKYFFFILIQKKNVDKRFDFSFHEMLFFSAPFSFFFTGKRLWWNDFLFTIKTQKWWSALKWKFSIVTKWKKKKIKVNTFRWRGSVQVKNDRLKNSNKNILTLPMTTTSTMKKEAATSAAVHNIYIYPQRNVVMSHKLFERKS